MANYNKNILIGVGGKDAIDYSHFVGAAYGMERMMGRVSTVVLQACVCLHGTIFCGEVITLPSTRPFVILTH